MKMKSSALKSVAIFLTALLTYETLATPIAQASMLAHPAPMNSSSSKILSSNSQISTENLRASKTTVPAFSLPAAVGSIVDTYAPSTSSRMIYHLQDVHHNVAAQTNLSEMVSSLEDYAAKQGKILVV